MIQMSGWPGAPVAGTRRPVNLLADDRSAESLRAILDRIGFRPGGVIGMEQVHGAEIAVVRGRADCVIPACDGLVTDVPGTALCVRSADCLPILAYDPVRQVVGAVHAGWRGLRSEIVRRLVRVLQEAFQSDPAQLRIEIGPGIGPCCYQVGTEFAEWAEPHLKHNRAGGLYADLAGLARAQLEGAGVPKPAIQADRACTACHPGRLESFRRDGPAAGRMVTAICLGCQINIVS